LQGTAIGKATGFNVSVIRTFSGPRRQLARNVFTIKIEADLACAAESAPQNEQVADICLHGHSQGGRLCALLIAYMAAFVMSHALLLLHSSDGTFHAGIFQFVGRSFRSADWDHHGPIEAQDTHEYQWTLRAFCQASSGACAAE
jgi:poly(3-hydroxyalkanoate) synthetase